MYKCKECNSITTLDYFSPDGVTCLDCTTEEQWQRFELSEEQDRLHRVRGDE
tara:strand:+ start:121 stop:276 length:156 start_codon:yes stop_codon:yes gene_type:complete